MISESSRSLDSELPPIVVLYIGGWGDVEDEYQWGLKAKECRYGVLDTGY